MRLPVIEFHLSRVVLALKKLVMPPAQLAQRVLGRAENLESTITKIN